MGLFKKLYEQFGPTTTPADTEPSGASILMLDGERISIDEVLEYVRKQKAAEQESAAREQHVFNPPSESFCGLPPELGGRPAVSQAERMIQQRVRMSENAKRFMNGHERMAENASLQATYTDQHLSRGETVGWRVARERTKQMISNVENHKAYVEIREEKS